MTLLTNSFRICDGKIIAQLIFQLCPPEKTPKVFFLIRCPRVPIYKHLNSSESIKQQQEIRRFKKKMLFGVDNALFLKIIRIV